MDAVTKKIDQMLKDHEAAIKRLRSFRQQYLASPDLREVIATLVSSEGAPPHRQNGDSGKPSPIRVEMLSDAPGMTNAIIEIVKEKPGIKAPELITGVLDRVTTKSSKPRRAVASTYDYLVSRKRIRKEGGAFYPVA